MSRKYKKISSETLANILFENKNNPNKTITFFADYDEINDEVQWAYEAKIIDFADSITLIINYIGGGAIFTYEFQDDKQSSYLRFFLDDYLANNGFKRDKTFNIWVKNDNETINTNTRIKHYSLKFNNNFITNQTLVDFKENKIELYRWLINHKDRIKEKDDIYIEEKEYACKEHITKDFSLSTKLIWSNLIHGFDLLIKNLLPRSKDDFSFYVEKSTNDSSIWHITYRNKTIVCFGTETYKPFDSSLIENAKITIQQLLNNPTEKQSQKMDEIDKQFYCAE